MAFLPIVRRELAVAARRPATYRQRVFFGAAALITVSVLFVFSPRTRMTGPMVFEIISWGGFVVCLLEGLRATADSIALERREGTLGLLLLTDARGRHVVIGKLASAGVQSLTAAISILPAFSLPLLLGGVTAGECWRVMISLLAALFTSIAVGTFASSFTRSSLAAFATALFLIVGLLAIPFIGANLGGIGLDAFKWLAGSLEMFIRVPDRMFDASIFWRATLVAGASAVLLVMLAGLVLERRPQIEGVNEDGWLQRWLRPKVGRTEAWGGASAKSSPSVWLAERTLPGQRALWLLVALGIIACFLAGWLGGKSLAVGIIFGVEVFVAFVIKLWAAAVAPISLNNARRNGALELLLCTPMSTSDIVSGQVDALYAYFVAPALVTAIGFPIAGVVGMEMAHTNAEPWFGVFGFFWFALFLLDFHALAYLGLWNGLTHARVDRAIAKTVFAVIILPWLTMAIPGLGCLGMIAWPAIWIAVGSSRLRKRFRDEAAKQFAADTNAAG